MLRVLQIFTIFIVLLLTGCFENVVKQGTSMLTSLGANLSSFSLKQPAITTEFSDADKSRVSLPRRLGKAKKLFLMPRAKDGGYLLTPGYYRMTVKSFCLQAGTHGPSKGDGYLYAPLKGDKSKLVKEILRSMEFHPNIKQSDIQMLLWAIISQTKFKDLSVKLQSIAIELLGKEGILEFSGGVLGLIPDAAMNELTSRLPPALKRIAEIENQMRALFSRAGSTYADIERLAVLSGAAVIDHPEYKRGRWSKHPDGYFVRYFPSGYSTTKVEVYVPRRSRSANPSEDFKFSTLRSPFLKTSLSHGQRLAYDMRRNRTTPVDLTDDIAAPANTGAQRLVLSNDSKDKKECDFSLAKACDGASGKGCKGVESIPYFDKVLAINPDYRLTKNYKNCTIRLFVSDGSVAHDSCCAKNPNGDMCWGKEKKEEKCKTEWEQAKSDVNNKTGKFCWYGPYYKGEKPSRTYIDGSCSLANWKTNTEHVKDGIEKGTNFLKEKASNLKEWAGSLWGD
jgi:hypothetical protein